MLWFTSFKACINTIMVHTGWKNPGHFKFTPKAGINTNEQAVSGTIKPIEAAQEPSKAQVAVPQKGMALTDIHGALSKVRMPRRAYCCILKLQLCNAFWPCDFCASAPLADICCGKFCHVHRHISGTHECR